MILLYESILSSTNSGRSKFVFTEFINALNKINGITKMRRITNFINFPKGFVPDSIITDSCIYYSWKSEEDGNKIMKIFDDFFKIGYNTVRKKITDLLDIPNFVIKRYKSDQKFYIIETILFKLNEYFVCLKISRPTEIIRVKDETCKLYVAFFNKDKKCVNKDIINLLD